MTFDSKEQLDEIFRLVAEYNQDDEGEVHMIELLGPYLQKRPNHVYAWYLYGDALRVVGRFEEAIKALKKALPKTPILFRSYVCARIGMAYEGSYSPGLAEKWLKRATEKEICDQGWAWVFRGCLLASAGKFPEALFAHREALKQINVDKEEAHLNIGYVLRAMGRYAEACKHFKKALVIDPEYSEALSALEGLKSIQKSIKMAREIESS